MGLFALSLRKFSQIALYYIAFSGSVVRLKVCLSHWAPESNLVNFLEMEGVDAVFTVRRMPA